MQNLTKEGAKALAANAAVELIQEGDIIAIGSGSTVDIAIKSLGKKFKESDRKPGIVAASRQSESTVKSSGLPLLVLDKVDSFRLMLDGADEVAPDLTLMKGGGGAHTREKLLARMTKTLVIMVDYTKLVPRIGETVPLPVEVVPFAVPYVGRELNRLGLEPTIRMEQAEERFTPFITDNGNHILDCRLPNKALDLPALDDSIKNLVGVVETGLFIGMVGKLFIGMRDGRVEEFHPGSAKKATIMPNVMREALLEKMTQPTRLIP